MLTVEVFSSPGCGKCTYAKETLKRVAAELGGTALTWREVDVLRELDYAVQLGALSTPAIAINGRLVFTALPSANKLRRTLQTELDKVAGTPPAARTGDTP